MSKRKFSYRMDDITEDMDWDKFLRMKEIFDRYEIKPLIGVVPCNQDPKLKQGQQREDFFEFIRTLQKAGWSIAQHGWQHTYVTKASGLLGLKRASEFAGVPYEEQYQKLKQGKEILTQNGIQADIFMAPGHTYDENTVKALVENGFQFVTDGYADTSYKYNGLQFIPCKSAGNPAKRGIDTICLHTNGMKEEDFVDVERVIRKNRKDIVDFKVLCGLSPKHYNILIRLQEKKNLSISKLKKQIAVNPVIQEYLRSHNDSNLLKKNLKRLAGLPMLVCRLLRK